jgi:hypothetical protein
MPQYEFKIGLTYGGLTNIESLTTPIFAPRSTYRQYAVRVGLGNDTVRGLGLPSATWSWGFLTAAQRDQLRTFCNEASAEVYIQTKKRESSEEYDVFTGVMIWPEDEEVSNDRVLDFTLEFRKLVEYTP